ncbi:hypothetical protein MAR_038569 [Mya arenaria]|uniref:Uncharacterized protein n=1 Tax=Mya arenaria TaxID=6604 RepID=A0ABY7FSA8_MYAAR|nr:hypothetical protein MAR_038569 [Mya arenaria]
MIKTIREFFFLKPVCCPLPFAFMLYVATIERLPRPFVVHVGLGPPPFLASHPSRMPPHGSQLPPHDPLLPPGGAQLPQREFQQPPTGPQLPSHRVCMPPRHVPHPPRGPKPPQRSQALPTRGPKLPTRGIQIPPPGPQLPSNRECMLPHVPRPPCYPKPPPRGPCLPPLDREGRTRLPPIERHVLDNGTTREFEQPNNGTAKMSFTRRNLTVPQIYAQIQQEASPRRIAASASTPETGRHTPGPVPRLDLTAITGEHPGYPLSYRPLSSAVVSIVDFQQKKNLEIHVHLYIVRHILVCSSDSSDIADANGIHSGSSSSDLTFTETDSRNATSDDETTVSTPDEWFTMVEDEEAARDPEVVQQSTLQALMPQTPAFMPRPPSTRCPDSHFQRRMSAQGITSISK